MLAGTTKAIAVEVSATNEQHNTERAMLPEICLQGKIESDGTDVHDDLLIISAFARSFTQFLYND